VDRRHPRGGRAPSCQQCGRARRHRAPERGRGRGADRQLHDGRPEGFGSLEEVADAIAEYLPHRPRQTNVGGLARNLRIGEDGRYRWHWDPAFMSRDRPRSSDDLGGFAAHAARLTMPVLLVRGRMSDVLSEEGAQDFLRVVPHAEYVDVRDAHHMVAGDRNDAFTDSVVDFLRRHRA
jgi:pimeloyl-ACP methyl ester carboxylesterase